MCDQQRLRPACAYAQSDQRLSLSLEYSMTVKLLTEQDVEFLSLQGGCAGSSESTLVKMPHCWKSRVTAQIMLSCKPFELMWLIFTGRDWAVVMLSAATGMGRFNSEYGEWYLIHCPG